MHVTNLLDNAAAASALLVQSAGFDLNAYIRVRILKMFSLDPKDEMSKHNLFE